MRLIARLAGAAAILAAVAQASAQYRGAIGRSYSRGMFNAMNGAMGEEFDDEGDEDGMEDRASRSMADRAASMPKSPLGRYLFSLDFTRTPETVLKARAKLAADAREESLNPPDTSHDDEPAQGGPEGMEDDGGMGMFMDGGAGGDAMLQRMMAEAMRQSGQAGLGAGIGMDGAGAVEGPGGPGDEQVSGPEQIPAVRAKPKVLTKGEKRAADRFRLLVVAGEWGAVREFLVQRVGEDAGAVYRQIVQRLANDTAIVPDEIIAVADASPGDLEDEQITALGRLLKSAVQRGADAGHVGALIAAGTRHFGGPDAAGRQRAASLLMSAGLPVEAHPFLDPLDQAKKDGNARLLNLHAMYFQGLAARKTDAVEKSEAIRRSWDLCLEVMGIENAPTVERVGAVRRAFQFLDEVPAEQGEGWLRDVFNGRRDLAWALVERACVRARMAKQQMRPVDDRVKALKRLQRVGIALVENAGDGLAEFRTALDMMSMTIIEELEFTKQMQQMPQRGGGEEQVPLVPSEMISTCLPTAAWLRAGDPGVAARLELMTAGVAGGAGDTAAVLEMVRPLVAVDKERAQKIADSVVAAWPSYVRPSRGYDSEMMYGGYGRARYFGGYNQYGGYGGYGGGYDGGVPLTRARQRRNLEQLGGLLSSLASLGLRPAAPGVLVAAFTASHSDAEVFSEDDIALVFGPLQSVSPAVAVELADSMRKRLGTIWRNAQVQQQAGTKRNDRQISAEVQRGYGLALKVAEAGNTGRAGEPDLWRAAVLTADLRFDLAEFLYGQKTDLATYSGLREQAFAGYASAAESYLADLRAGRTQPSSLVYFHWVSSALGASDLGFLTRQDQPDNDQVDRVIAALGEMPEAMRNRHLGLFAKDVTGAMQTIAPELKVRFLTNACRVIGDHPEGASARKQLAYYNDLNTEVELVLDVEGGSVVGSKEPFGAHLSVWSTRAVSRESGGFGKYLMNQQYHPFTGQPVDYRDDLEKKVRETLAERFEVLSVTFHKPGLPPMGVPREGWEQHPLAFLMLKARDASVDRIPSLKLDVDFTDGQGMVILPIASAVRLIDARTEPAGEGGTMVRRVHNMEIEQTLDARDAANGVLKLEVRAAGLGLVPSLERLLDTSDMRGLRISKAEDHGLAVADLDTSGDHVEPRCERSWSLELAGEASRPLRDFTFAALRPEWGTVGDGNTVTKVTLQRFSDADIVPCAAVVAIDLPGRGTPGWVVAVVGGVLVIGAGVVGWLVVRRRGRDQTVGPVMFTIPDRLTPVSAIALLNRIAAVPGVRLDAGERTNLAGEIREIEVKFFSPSQNAQATPGERDEWLRGVVTRWSALAESRVSV